MYHNHKKIEYASLLLIIYPLHKLSKASPVFQSIDDNAARAFSLKQKREYTLKRYYGIRLIILLQNPSLRDF